jgi:hypothetical protein
MHKNLSVMKNLSKLLIAAIVIVCCFETACNKQEDPFMPGSWENNSFSPLSLKSGSVFTVSPSADLKDSKAIQRAFADAVAAGPGSTVQLTKGTFVLDERIEVEGFVGCFRGIGKEKTIITTPLDKPVDFSLPDPDLESLIKFRHGSINVSDFTIKILNPHPCSGILDNWTDAFPSLISFTGNSVKARPTTDQAVSLTVNNVNYIGLHYLDAAGTDIYNVNYPLYISWDGYVADDYYRLKGNVKITNCVFKGSFNGIFISSDATCKIGSNDNYSGNEFDDLTYGVMIYDCSNASFDVSSNCFTKMIWGAVQLVQGWFITPSIISKFSIRNNHMEIEMNGDAIWLVDSGNGNGEGKKMNVNVSDNKIYLNNILYGGIWGCYAQDVLVTNNKIWGNCGIAGIYSSTLEHSGDDMSGWVIKDNNVQGLEAQVAPIWLNSSSHDNIVIGSSLNTTVFDEGTNNILINVNRKHWDHFPQEIHDKMMKHHEKMNSFRGHRR